MKGANIEVKETPKCWWCRAVTLMSILQIWYMSLMKEQINKQTPPGFACSPPFNLILVPLYYYLFQTASLQGFIPRRL